MPENEIDVAYVAPTIKITFIEPAFGKSTIANWRLLSLDEAQRLRDLLTTALTKARR